MVNVVTGETCVTSPGCAAWGFETAAPWRLIQRMSCAWSGREDLAGVDAEAVGYGIVVIDGIVDIEGTEGVASNDT